MILSASRRTDIPAFYSAWFLNRIKAGYALVRPPFHAKMIRRIPLTRDEIDCIVFWTKNPRPMMPYLSLLDEMGYPYYFQFTLTPYGAEIETHLPPKADIISTFITLSSLLGKNRVIWRYDPILLTSAMNIDDHILQFAALAERLHDFTRKCIISFFDCYRKCARNMRPLQPLPLDDRTMRTIAAALQEIAASYDLQLETCAEEIDLSSVGIQHARCIDDRLIAELFGRELRVVKDRYQRPACGCVSSVDIGAYDSCPHHCLYCYANANARLSEQNYQKHNPESPLLIGEVTDGAIPGSGEERSSSSSCI
ncbi:DUF1848 domain-containing protein [candidate division KSB1 bacterium]|nr:DUF1848 domain-containing protein [candidate division KSB1 bacterium]RQW07409.1 MAG: DUF1848 domain-containing protein [candidate division KSB1 bacterium]